MTTAGEGGMTTLAPPVFVERDIFCRTCRELIDHHQVDREHRDSGMVTALLVSDAVQAHRHTGCPCEGWEPGPWSDEVPA